MVHLWIKIRISFIFLQWQIDNSWSTIAFVYAHLIIVRCCEVYFREWYIMFGSPLGSSLRDDEIGCEYFQKIEIYLQSTTFANIWGLRGIAGNDNVNFPFRSKQGRKWKVEINASITKFNGLVSLFRAFHSRIISEVAEDGRSGNRAVFHFQFMKQVCVLLAFLKEGISAASLRSARRTIDLRDGRRFRQFSFRFKFIKEFLED